MEYKITACPSFMGLGLCNQLCLVLNALAQAFQVVSNGVGVVLKTEIHHASYGGKVLETFPDWGYQWVNHQTLLDGYDPQPGVIKFLDIQWHQKLKYESRYREGSLIHWLDRTPSSVCVYIDGLRTHFSQDQQMPYSQVLDLDHMNRFLSQWAVRLECQPHHLTPNSLYFMEGGNTPRNTILFKKLISLMRFHPSFYDIVSQWLGGRNVYHIIHLRNENDAIDHWSSITKMNPLVYQEKLHDAYKQHIETYIHKEKLTVILTALKENNPMIAWMEQEGYHIDYLHYQENESSNREILAIYDLILATYCQEIFIGVFQIGTPVFAGSTFSFFVSHFLPPSVQTILIDIDHLT